MPSSTGQSHANDFPYRWRVRTRLPDRFGQRLRVLIRAGKMNSCLVEFEDGAKFVTSRNFMRKAKS